MKTFSPWLAGFFFGVLSFGAFSVAADENPAEAGKSATSPLDPKHREPVPAGMRPRPRPSPFPTATPHFPAEPPQNWKDYPVPASSGTPKH